MFFRTQKVFTSSRVAQKKRKHRAVQFGFVFLFFLIIVIVLGWASWIPEINIQRITIFGNTTVSEEDIRAYLEKRMTKGYLYIFSRANVFLFQPRIIEQELFEVFKKIKEVNVSRNSLTSIVVHVSERKPYYLWCDKDASVRDAEPCYFLDIDGLAFAPAPYFSGNVYFKFFKSFESAGSDPVGNSLFSEGEFKRLISLRNALREFNLDTYALEIEKNGDHVFLLTENGKILFHPKQDFTIVADNLRATFDAEQFIKKQKSGLTLEYIDVRFDNKVYYRFK